MKNFKNLISLFLVIVSFSFISCENEPLDSSLLGANSTNNNSGGGGNTSSGDYWPAALNNTWSFSTNGAASQQMKIVSTSSLNGYTYYNFNSILGQGTQVSGTAAMGMRKGSGDYYIKVYSSSANIGGGITANQSDFEFLVLKDYLSVGQTWNGSYTQTTSYSGGGISLPSATTNSNYVGTILGTGLTEIVDGETFTNVIKLSIAQTVVITGNPTATNLTTTYWFAKNVGIIKSETVNAGTTSTSVLTDYILN